MHKTVNEIPMWIVDNKAVFINNLHALTRLCPPELYYGAFRNYVLTETRLVGMVGASGNVFFYQEFLQQCQQGVGR